MKPIIPNLLSSVRIVLALTMIFVPIHWRVPILLVAIVTDFLDGFLARRWGVVSKVGTIIDPIGDKAFALILSYLYWTESYLTLWDLIALFLRDIVIILFSIFLLLSRQWGAWKIQSFICGKLATLFQAIFFLYLMCGDEIPSLVPVALFIVGMIAPFELLYRRRTLRTCFRISK